MSYYVVTLHLNDGLEIKGHFETEKAALSFSQKYPSAVKVLVIRYTIILSE